MQTKVTNSTLKTVRAGYLYANKKLVLIHEQSHPRAGKVEWATVHDVETNCQFTGRIVLHRRGIVRLILQAIHVRATNSSIEHGSEASKEKGIAVGTVSLQIGPDAYEDCVFFYQLEGLLGTDLCYQPNNAWIEPSNERWADYRIAA